MEQRMTRKQSGFSLLELVVVMAILAALATVALRAVSNNQNQARYQQTTRTLTDIRDAIVGPANQRNPDGTPLITGFVADTGNLPVYYGGGDPLAELTTNPNSIGSYAPATTSDPNLTINAGWQGPYLRLGVGASTILDGWGNPFHLYDSSGATPPSSAVAQITSWGADNNADPSYGGTGGTTGYNADVGIKLGSSGGGVNYQATLTGSIQIFDASNNPVVFPLASPFTWSGINAAIYVVYFGPNGGNVVETPATVSATNGQFTVAGTIGPRVLRAYVVPFGTTWGPGVALAAIAKSAPLNIVATGGGQTVPNLVIRNYAP